MIPFLFALTFPILLTFVFAIPGLFLLFRLPSFIGYDSEYSYTDDMKVHTFYSIREGQSGVARLVVIPIVGVVFGGIHCAGWSFNFPSNDEAMLWRVCSAILTGIAFISPVHVFFLYFLAVEKDFKSPILATVISVLTILVYVVSRLLLLVEAVISLRHHTPGMLALVKWTSFIPHI